LSEKEEKQLLEGRVLDPASWNNVHQALEGNVPAMEERQDQWGRISKILIQKKKNV